MRKYLSSVAFLLFTASGYSAQAVISSQRSSDDTVYEVMATNTNGCNDDGYEDLTSDQCHAYAFSHGGVPDRFVSQWSDEPKGCHIHRCTAYFNTSPGARANIESAPVCKRSIPNTLPPQANPESYLVNNECHAYAFSHGGDPDYIFASQWYNEPKGCHIHGCDAYFNTSPYTTANIESAPVCKRSIPNTLPPQANPESYLVNNARTNWCADGYEPLTPAECNMYTCFTNRPSYEAGNWPDDPKGCVISYGESYEDQIVYFNEHSTGAGNDVYRPVCKPSHQFVLDGPKNIVRTAVNTPDGVILSPPTDYRLSFTIEPLGTIREFGNIIHFTTGDRMNKAPAIFFSKGSTKLYIQISTDSFPDPFPTHQSLALERNKSHEVVLTVVGSTSTLSVNGTPEVKSITARSQYAKLDVYVGSPWYEPANAIISDIQFFSTPSEIARLPDLESRR
eukprot:CAMPEP_0194298092 /NCGR_PEP_ID=MMETSP0169-20130528/59974_1 /TAXON_ID=218684 /ORGANISM="Corethron pennatum, Strain L29A3" /LENGTH=449 /DNA_ID=CAMNT_0039048039 /DNA_START=135 /DNA_END=1484 /DNA_ORIENTATION=+